MLSALADRWQVLCGMARDTSTIRFVCMYSRKKAVQSAVFCSESTRIRSEILRD